MRILNLILLTWLSLNSLPAVAEYNQDRLILAAYKRAQDIVRLYPPERYFIINLGLSTTALSAAFREMIPERVNQDAYYRDLPLEDLSSLVRPISPLREFEQLVRRMMPDEKMTKGREIVFVRVLQMGVTMAGFMKDVIDSDIEAKLDKKFRFHLFPRIGDETGDYMLREAHERVALVYDSDLSYITTMEENRNRPESLSNFGQYEVMHADDFRVGHKLVENPRHRRLDERLKNLLDTSKVGTKISPDISGRISLMRCANDRAG